MRNFIASCQGESLDEPSLLPPGTRLGPYFGSGFNEGRPELRGRKIHYRIVFKEDCVPIRRKKSPSTVLNALADISQGADTPRFRSPIVDILVQSPKSCISTGGCIAILAVATS